MSHGGKGRGGGRGRGRGRSGSRGRCIRGRRQDQGRSRSSEVSRFMPSSDSLATGQTVVARETQKMPQSTAPVGTLPAFSRQSTTAGRGQDTIAVIDQERCAGCGLCTELCPEGAISMVEEMTVDRSVCTGCGACAQDCPMEAIRMVARDGGDSESREQSNLEESV